VVSVATTEYRFSPNRLVFKRGVAYRLHLENRGKETHEFTAPQFFKAATLGNPEVLNADRTEIVLQPGEAIDLRFIARQRGHYPLRCADHDWAGMTGEITVK
ncbi:MAG: cupredoxin domain-containing protein, partial [Thiohalocapsa sp.]